MVLHQTLDLESSGILEWVSWHIDCLWIEPPSLVSSVVAFVPDNVSVLSVRVSSNIKALSAIVSDVLVCSTVVSNLLVGLVSVESGNSWLVISEFVSSSS